MFERYRPALGNGNGDGDGENEAVPKPVQHAVERVVIAHKVGT
jgi:hypothetical protein